MNCAGEMPDSAEEIAPIFKEGLKKGDEMPDIIIVGLQEIVALNMQSIFAGKSHSSE